MRVCEYIECRASESRPDRSRARRHGCCSCPRIETAARVRVSCVSCVCVCASEERMSVCVTPAAHESTTHQ
jgi:hypothetical protein